MNEYLSWLDRETQGVWWHDSAVPAEVTEAAPVDEVEVYNSDDENKDAE